MQASKDEIKENFREKIEAQFFDQENKPYMLIIEEQKIKNANTFLLYLEDHTLGNLLRMELLNNKNVRFAGYRVPHPLEDKVEIKVHTGDQQNPISAVDDGISDLVYKLDNLDKQLEEQLQQHLYN